MSEVNWDENARAAVKAFHWWLGDDANCGLELDETLGKFMEKVVARKAVKTVADAVEYHQKNGKICGYSFSQNKMLSFCKSNGTYCFVSEKSSAGSVETDDWQPICTRAEFEAYVKEQECEKWTHTIDGLRVRFLVDGPDEAGEVPVVSDDGYYRIFDVDQLKPIKQKLTKAQAWDLCQDYDGPKSMKAYMYDLHEEHDII